LVPARREPQDIPLAAVAVDRGVLGLAELHLAAIVDVRKPPPRRVALHVPLIARDTLRRGPFLELHRVPTGQYRAVDQLLRDLDRSVVVDPDLGDDEDALSVTDALLSDGDARVGHECTSLRRHQ